MRKRSMKGIYHIDDMQWIAQAVGIVYYNDLLMLVGQNSYTQEVLSWHDTNTLII